MLQAGTVRPKSIPGRIMPLALYAINAAPAPACIAMLTPLIERAAWLLDDVPKARPFTDVAAVADAIEAAIRDAPPEDRLRLLRGHPELAGVEAMAGAMTAESDAEQGRLGLAALAPAARDALVTVNALYRQRFGWPYVVALHRLASLDAILADARRRLQAAPPVEIHTALGEVVSVMRDRCRRLIVDDPQAGAMLRKGCA